MAAGHGTATLRCPACSEELPVPYRAQLGQDTDPAVLTFDTRPVREHAAQHDDTPDDEDRFIDDRCCGCSGEQCCTHGEAPCSTS